MSETIILAIVVCSCMVAIALIIVVGILIYNYQDNKNLGRSYQLLQLDIDRLDTRVEKLEFKVDNSQKE